MKATFPTGLDSQMRLRSPNKERQVRLGPALLPEAKEEQEQDEDQAQEQ